MSVPARMKLGPWSERDAVTEIANVVTAVGNNVKAKIWMDSWTNPNTRVRESGYLMRVYIAGEYVVDHKYKFYTAREEAKEAAEIAVMRMLRIFEETNAKEPE